MLIDTEVPIRYLRGHNKAAQRLDDLPELRVSAIVWMELVQGCRNRIDLGRLKKDLGRRRAQI
jgi:predicted nucleic acid-binding protein